MPISYLRRLTGRERSQQRNRHLAFFLSFIAGAINAGGFLAVGQYTSHMSGIIASMSDNFALGSLGLLFGGFASLLFLLLALRVAPSVFTGAENVTFMENMRYRSC